MNICLIKGQKTQSLFKSGRDIVSVIKANEKGTARFCMQVCFFWDMNTWTLIFIFNVFNLNYYL